ncbi:MAG: RNA polymerase sigma factor [Fimbriiglobus sp.]
MVRPMLCSPDDDGILVERFLKESSREAFASLIDRHGPIVRRYCLGQLPSHDADDAFQAVFIVFATKAESIRRPSSLRSWLLGTARRVIRHTRRQRRPMTLTQDVPGRDQAEAWLDEELSRLPSSIRDVVVLCLVERYPQAEAATRLGISERTLRRRLETGREQLREQLTRRGLAPAVILALFTGLAQPSQAVPATLLEATIATTFRYLLGETTSAAGPILLASGVLTTMSQKLTVAVLLTLASVALVVGIGFSDDPKPVAKSEPPATTKPAEPAKPTETAKTKGPWRAPFRVQCDIPAFERAITNELQFQYRLQSEIWTGGTILEGEEAECNVVWDPHMMRTNPNKNLADSLAYHGIVFEWKVEGKPDWGNRKLDHLLIGPGVAGILTSQSEIIATRHLLAAYCNQERRLPEWLEFAISWYRGLDANSSVANRLKEGNAIRLRKYLCPQDFNKPASEVCREQGLSVMHFLLSVKELGPNLPEFRYKHEGKILTKPLNDIPAVTPLTQDYNTDRRRNMAFAEFVKIGMDKGWDAASKAIYGFENVDKLEAAWIEWVLKQADPKKEVKNPNPDLIPPVKP